MKCSAPCSAVLRHIPPRPGLQSSTGRRWCRKLWGRPGNTTSTLFPGPPRSPRPPPILRTSRTSAASYPLCAPRILFLCGDTFRQWNVPPLVPPFCAIFPLVLGCSRLLLVGVDAENSEVVQETLHPLFFLAPHAARAPHQFSEHHALRQPRILYARHESRKQDPPPPAKSRLDALTSRLDKRVQILLVGPCVFSFRMVFLYVVTTGWIFDISLLCENSINQWHTRRIIVFSLLF